ncbi:succinate dehydrogenase assembly factor 2 [Coxiella endosymbiont of Amblyomma sculptum]|uniref:FAD assembly factor SdhE n=1 Tax=Coxiella endosymbiont of Amblyomma sculptum TaxID=2487929 RepID=UPI00132F2186|nr:succinate dehydrogenase assembly factor 2 [Coxiella endosymbiont of Amblyomma sculptum]QHG92554.1 succinate dehydrogenase assembly factor 2 [Coxiella endosymbiont of Amblyomma sculptum]
MRFSERFSESKKIKLKCRRGILELDIILNRFYKKKFQNLSAEEKKLFNQLLDESDSLLYDWLLGCKTSLNSRLQSLIEKITDLAIEKFSN